MDIIKKTTDTIKKYSMLNDGDSVLIGLSGGPDSVCMTIILDKLKKEFKLTLNAVYIDHGLRPGEVQKEKEFCKDLCRNFGISFFAKSIDVKKIAEDSKLNKQEAARELRYSVFEEMSMELNEAKIAVGHTADDQAETVLMRLLRGSGRKGLSGIPPVRGKIIRPLIEIEREEIEEFLSDNTLPVTRDTSLSYVVDSSNIKTDYFRNRIRKMIIPELKKNNPSLLKSISRTAEILGEEDVYLELIVTKTLMRLISRKSDDAIELFLAPLERMEKPILRRVLRRAVAETKGIKGIDFVHIEDVIKLVKHGKSGDRIKLPGGIYVIKEYSLLMITSRVPVTISEYELQPTGEVIIRESGVLIRAAFEGENRDFGDGRTSVLLDAGGMSFPLKIRPRIEGDFFFPLGFGKKKKLHDFFVDEKIPRDERGKIPVVLSGNDIIWIAGCRADERFKVTDRTEKLLRLIISGSKSR